MLGKLPDRVWLIAAIAVVAGGLAAWSARQHLLERTELIEARARVPMVQRLVAAYDLAVGTRLQADHVAVRDIPAAYAASDSLVPERFNEIDGGLLNRPLRQGDPIVAAYVGSAAEAFSTKVGAGRRAVTMPVDETSALSGMLAPGDLIDLYVSFEHRRRQITAPLLQGVLVLATGRQTLGDDQEAHRAYSSITLDVAPEDAVKLVVARQAGRVTAMLRHPSDDRATRAAARGDLAALLGIEKAERDTTPEVPVIYGDRRVRGVPNLNNKQANDPSDVGLFELDAPEAVVSAWMAALRERSHQRAGIGETQP